MEAETAAAAAHQRQEEADETWSGDAAIQESDTRAPEQADLNQKAKAAGSKAKAAREKVIETAESTRVEPPDLEALAADAIPRRGMARKTNDTSTMKTKRILSCAKNFTYTYPDSHLMQPGGSYLQGYNCQQAVNGAHQVIVAIVVNN
jgi:hypothetical protein